MAQPSAKLPGANAFTTSHTKLAACLVALGFPWQHKVRHRQADGRDYITFLFGTRSTRSQFPVLDISCAQAWGKGTLDEMHPLCVMMRALHNRERILDMHKGAECHLVAVAAGHMTKLVPGPENPSILSIPRSVQTDDLDLVSAIAGVGIPPTLITGSAPLHWYHLPRHGFTLKGDQGQPVMHDAHHFMRRAPTAQDPQRLALEDEDPLHPVVLAYDALTVRAELQAIIRRSLPSLLIEDRGMQAEVSVNYTGRVMDKIARRFGTVAP